MRELTIESSLGNQVSHVPWHQTCIVHRDALSVTRPQAAEEPAQGGRDHDIGRHAQPKGQRADELHAANVGEAREAETAATISRQRRITAARNVPLVGIH